MDCQEAVIERNGMHGIQLPVFRAIYVSSFRHRLLAEAFSLTGDIERYGPGFVRIREILQAYPEIVLRVEEMGDFFKVELQQVAEVPPQIALLISAVDHIPLWCAGWVLVLIDFAMASRKHIKKPHPPFSIW